MKTDLQGMLPQQKIYLLDSKGIAILHWSPRKPKSPARRGVRTGFSENTTGSKSNEKEGR